LPEPACPNEIVSQGTLLALVQAHPAVPVTVTLPLPPEEGNVALGGEIEKKHCADASCGSKPAASRTTAARAGPDINEGTRQPIIDRTGLNTASMGKLQMVIAVAKPPVSLATRST
jgi:hypothetical protein